jgi:hypothetical protein
MLVFGLRTTALPFTYAVVYVPALDVEFCVA